MSTAQTEETTPPNRRLRTAQPLSEPIPIVDAIRNGHAVFVPLGRVKRALASVERSTDSQSWADALKFIITRASGIGASDREPVDVTRALWPVTRRLIDGTVPDRLAAIIEIFRTPIARAPLAS